MFKRFNLFALSLLIIGQTVFGPIASVGAVGVDDEVETTTVGVEGLSDSVEEPVDPKDDIEVVVGDNNDVSTEDEGTAIGRNENGNKEDKEVRKDPSKKNPKVQSSEKDTLDDEFVILAENGTNDNDGATPQEIPYSMTGFDLTINGDQVTDIDRELNQDEVVKGSYKFSANVENGAHKKGSYFTFKLPETILEFDNNSFNGSKEATEDSPAFSYSTSGQTVMVTLDEDIDPGLITSELDFIFEFTAEFKFVGDSLEQKLEIPNLDGGTKIFTLIFLPETKDEEMSKKSKGVETTLNGERHITWEVWVNKAGRNLNNATLEDSPSMNPKHTIISDSVNVEQYEVGLNGWKKGTKLITDGNFSDVIFSGKNAYKITYETKAEITDSEGNYLSGEQKFTNTITLKDKNGATLDTANSEQRITFGKAMGKRKVSGNNYTSKWEIIYNYNQAPIPDDKAVIIDELSGSHDIKVDGIVVEKVKVNTQGEVTDVERTLTEGTEYELINVTGSGFELKINADDGAGNVTGAYRITYDADYTNTEYPRFVIDGEEITNKVYSKTHPEVVTAEHTLTEDILRKDHTVDFDKKEINWTITVTADGSEDITNLEIIDEFSKKGTHKLTGDINVEGMTRQTVTPDTNPSKGFTITGGTVKAGETATITYKTKFNIKANGSVDSEGYENVATANWEDSSENEYTLTKNSHYTPDESTKNNGFKTGSFNYETQEFEWKIRVNVNKQNINDAVLYDGLGTGHVIKDDSFSINEYKFTDVDNDRKGEIGDELDESLYTLSPNEDGKGFTLTFSDDLGDKNNKVYLVTYKSVDENDIIGIESDNENEVGNKYANGATFKTKIGNVDKEFTLPTKPVEVKYANELISKSATPNAENGTYIWEVNVNRSHSSLGDVVLKDLPSDNLMLLPGSIEYREVTQNATSGDLTPSSWKPVDEDFELGYTDEGGFELNLGNMTKKSYDIRYITLVLGKKDETFENNAKIKFGFGTSENQKTRDDLSSGFAFSASSAHASSGKGNIAFKKVGYNPATGEKVPLENVTFQLVKTVSGTDYVMAEETSNRDGEFSFENVRYGTYKIVEEELDGYDPLQGYENFVIDKNNDTLLEENEDKVIEIINNQTIDPGQICDAFTLTVKDVDGVVRHNVNVKFVQDGNDVFEPTTTTEVNGQIIVQRDDLPAGKYEVIETDGNNDEISLGSVKVIYQDGCQDEAQPAPTCTDFKITVKNENNDVRTNVTVTVKDKVGNVIVTAKTNSNGEIEIPSENLPAGEYVLYEGDLFIKEFDVSYKDNCEAEVRAAPVCDDFTLTIQERNGDPFDNVEVTVKDNEGNEVVTDTTDTDGKITIDQKKIKQGTYKVYEGTKLINSFTVKDKCSETITPRPTGGGGTPPAPTCDNFTITVKQNGTPVEAGIELTLKSGSTDIAIGTTDADGKMKFDENDLPEGTYTAYDKDGNEIGTITVTYDEDECQAELNLTEPGTDPDEPGDGEDPEDKDDSEEPGGENPGKPGDDKPTDPGKPGDPNDGSGVKGDGNSSDDSNATDKGNVKVSVDGGDDDGNKSDQTGKFLPKTATNAYNLIFAGFGILLIGFILLYVRKRRSA